MIAFPAIEHLFVAGEEAILIVFNPRTVLEDHRRSVEEGCEDRSCSSSLFELFCALHRFHCTELCFSSDSKLVIPLMNICNNNKAGIGLKSATEEQEVDQFAILGGFGLRNLFF